MSNKITEVPINRDFGNTKPRPNGQTGWSPTYTPPTASDKPPPKLG